MFGHDLIARQGLPSGLDSGVCRPIKAIDSSIEFPNKMHSIFSKSLIIIVFEENLI